MSMIKHKISIIMPFKNEERFLGETLESILNQSERDFELIAVDDHSSDESAKIVSEYAAKDSRIKLCSNEGSGTICALQTALKHAPVNLSRGKMRMTYSQLINLQN